MLESFPESAWRLRDILTKRTEQSVGEMFTVRAILGDQGSQDKETGSSSD